MTRKFTAGSMLLVLSFSLGCQGGMPIGQTALKQSVFGSMFTAQSSSSPGDPFQNPGPPARLQGATMTNGRVIVEGTHQPRQPGVTVNRSAPAIVRV